MSNLARRAAIRTSQPRARFMPAPTAAPLTAASVGQRAAGDAQEALVDAAEAAAVGLPEVAEVRSGAERRWCSGHDDGTDRLVGLDRVHGGDDLGDHRSGQRVAFVGVVERERGHAVGDIGQDQGHAGSLSRSVEPWMRHGRTSWASGERFDANSRFGHSGGGCSVAFPWEIGYARFLWFTRRHRGVRAFDIAARGHSRGRVLGQLPDQVRDLIGAWSGRCSSSRPSRTANATRSS